MKIRDQGIDDAKVEARIDKEVGIQTTGTDPSPFGGHGLQSAGHGRPCGDDPPSAPTAFLHGLGCIPGDLAVLVVIKHGRACCLYYQFNPRLQ